MSPPVYFPKISKMIAETIDAQFQTDCFDRLSSFILELKRLYTLKSLLAAQTVAVSLRIVQSTAAVPADIADGMILICQQRPCGG